MALLNIHFFHFVNAALAAQDFQMLMFQYVHHSSAGAFVGVGQTEQNEMKQSRWVIVRTLKRNNGRRTPGTGNGNT